MEIPGRRCLLRPLVASDAPSLAAHANDREVWLNLRDRFPHPYTLADASAYIAAVAARPRQTSFGIVVDGEAAGMLVRESDNMVTDYFSRVAPHVISDGLAPSEAQVAQWLAERVGPDAPTLPSSGG